MRVASHRLMRLTIMLFVPALAYSAILPETIGHWQRGEPGPAPVPAAKVWAEYGLQDSESAPYADGGQKYSIDASRFSDATGAMAGWDAMRPADAKPVGLMGLAVQTDADEYVAAGNYLFVFRGYKIHPDELSHVVATVPHYGHSPLPTLPKYLPAGALPNSERYITGPESLALYAPAVSPSTAAFRCSAEAAVAKYGAKGKETSLLIFSYPTDQAEVTLPQHGPTPKDNPVNFFWTVFILCGVLAAFCVLSGVVVGGIRVLLRRYGDSGEGDEMISLHLTGTPAGNAGGRPAGRP